MTNGHGTRWFCLLATLLCCTATAAARDDVAFEAGVRAGVGLPLGKVSDPAGDLDDAVGSQIPLQLDLGVRLFRKVFLGAYVQYGFAFPSDDFPGCGDTGGVEIDCSAHDVRLGIEVLYHFLPHGKLDPWAGVGFGYEWATLSEESGNAELSWHVSGFEFVSFQFGLDVALSEHVRVGPFLSLSLAQYDDATLECSAPNVCNGSGVYNDIDDKALHEWLMLGVRVSFGT